MALGVSRSPINAKFSGDPKCLQGRGLGQIHKETTAWACIPWGVCYNRGMKQEKLPQGTPREDNENIVEWFADNGKILQLVYLPSGTHYRFVRKGIIQDGYWPASKFSLASMLDLLNR